MSEPYWLLFKSINALGSQVLALSDVTEAEIAFGATRAPELSKAFDHE